MNNTQKTVLVGTVAGAALGYWLGEGNHYAIAGGAVAGGTIAFFISGVVVTNAYNLASQDAMKVAWQDLINADFV